MKGIENLVKLKTTTDINPTSAYSSIDLFAFSILNFNNNYFLKH